MSGLSNISPLCSFAQRNRNSVRGQALVQTRPTNSRLRRGGFTEYFVENNMIFNSAFNIMLKDHKFGRDFPPSQDNGVLI